MTRARLIASLLVASAVVATWVALAASARSFEVARPGASAEYWEHLCGVQLPTFRGHHQYANSGAALRAVDGTLYYYDQLHHEQVLYGIPIDAPLRDVPAVVTALAADEPEEDAEPCPKRDHDAWKRCHFQRGGRPKREACRRHLAANGAVSSTDGLLTLAATVRRSGDSAESDEEDAALLERLRRGHRVGLSLLFEGIYLTAWWGFVAWSLLPFPWSLSWRWRVGLGPLLLAVPYFLGYAPMTFTFGPSGGFVYPLYLFTAGVPLSLVPCSAADGFVVRLLPRPLASLSQLPGSPRAFSFILCLGPVSCLIAGIALVLVLTGLGAGFRVLSKTVSAKRRRAD